MSASYTRDGENSGRTTTEILLEILANVIRENLLEVPSDTHLKYLVLVESCGGRLQKYFKKY